MGGGLPRPALGRGAVLWAESYFYRKLLEAVGFFTPGPWFWVDPFEPTKAAEVRGAQFGSDLAALDEQAELSLDDRAQAVLLGAVWGNQADLGFRLNAELTDVNSPERQHLIHDDSAAVRSYLGAEPGKVCLIADNAGTELLADLILVDDLPHTGMASKISIHVKPYPYYVSDTITADLLACLRRLAEGRGYGHAAADRLWRALREGRLAVDTHPFYCQPWSFHYMPADLANGSARHRQRRSELPPARRRPSLACYRVFRGRDGVLPCVGTPEVRCRSRPGRDGRRRSGCC